MANKTLQDWRDAIRKEVRFVGRKPYSHNIISICLSAIDKDHGTKEANRAIVDFKLEKLGWHKIHRGEEQ